MKKIFLWTFGIACGVALVIDTYAAVTYLLRTVCER